MKIEIRSKIPVTSSELDKIESVSRDRFRLSEARNEIPKKFRASYSPETKQVESV